MDRKGNAIILLGPPGSGKSSLADKIERGGHIAVLESGALLRREMEKGGKLGGRIGSYVEKGQLVPSSLMVEVLGQAMGDMDATTVLFDGFPRQMDQVIPFFAMVAENGYKLIAVILLQVSKEVGTRRITGRRLCSDCGAVYHLDFDPPVRTGVCDHCGGELVKREDDTIETVNNRWAAYESQTRPVIKYLTTNYAGLIYEISTEKDVGEVFNEVTSIVYASSHASSRH